MLIKVGQTHFHVWFRGTYKGLTTHYRLYFWSADALSVYLHPHYTIYLTEDVNHFFNILECLVDNET